MHRLGSLPHHFISIFRKPVLNPCCTFSYTPHSTEIVYDQLVKLCDRLSLVKQTHSALTVSSLVIRSPHLAAQIIVKYATFGDPNSSRSLFNYININRDTDKSSSFLWNTIIRVYANAGLCFETLELYMLMRRADISSNNYTFPFIFKACASYSLLFEGKVAHAHAVKTGFDSELFVEKALVDMYVKCGQFCDGRKIFDEMPVRDVFLWTAMITAYEQAEKPEEALFLFQRMQQADLLADEVTIVSVASAVGQLGDVRKAQSIHAYAVRHLFLEKIFVGNSILAMLTKCGNVKKARLHFDMMNEKNVITWNSMLSGYSQNGQASEALVLFEDMHDSICKPNAVTALIMVSACAYLGSRHLGKKFHDFILDSNMKMDDNLQNALMDMYAKCGDLETSLRMFNDVHPHRRSSSSWNVLISGYGMHGHAKEALELFSRMQEGVEPNHITFTSILSACSHAGLIDEGREVFRKMTKLSVRLELKHYACMVDMLGRAGLLREAFDLIKEMPLRPDDTVWGALLLACKIHGNMELGKIAADNLFQLEPDHTGYYVLMSNIYAASNKWQEVVKLRQDMKNRGMQKPSALSLIEYGDEIHGFYTADRENPYWLEVYRKVESLANETRIAGHIPDLSCALHDVEDEEKEHILNHHSEKLAVAFGILKLDPKMVIRITKNLRVCNDCHSAFKFISKIYDRKIIVRDANRFHQFQSGTCSCNDYW